MMPKSKDSPLVNKYFGKYLDLLIEAQKNHPHSGRFFQSGYYPGLLEKRLERIEVWHQTQAIVDEVGEISDPVELDRRLMDVWAEIRVIDLLVMEGFHGIRKVREKADLEATCQNQSFAFQVKRINNSLQSQVLKRNPAELRNIEPYGEITEIYDGFAGPLSYFFWDALLDKNAKFKDYMGVNRCIVIASGDEDLQDPMLRHIACQQIRDGLYDPALVKRNFEYLLWLPDTSPGAWFTVNEDYSSTRCFADWKDEPGSYGWEDLGLIQRKEVDLNSSINAWIIPTQLFHICKQ